ncbi:MAG: hypothetical protein FWG08_04745 [Propionibacteriaceae bacterium]|nr:hypothetical protein [Propionibacteriaceae bacterium]
MTSHGMTGLGVLGDDGGAPQSRKLHRQRNDSVLLRCINGGTCGGFLLTRRSQGPLFTAARTWFC